MSDFSRRKFLKTGAAALAGITIAPSSILGMSHGHVSPTDKLNLAAVGRRYGTCQHQQREGHRKHRSPL